MDNATKCLATVELSFAVAKNQSLAEKAFAMVSCVVKVLDAIKNKVLHPCSHAFAMDPVRFLRAFRFRVNLVFEFSILSIVYILQILTNNFLYFSVIAVMKNRWLSNGFKESAMQAAIWSVMAAKRR